MSELSPELQAYIPRFIQIESGGNPNARTGSYSGLLQMGPDEIAKYGGNGLEQGTQLLADRAAELSKVLGREPTAGELYLAHQQGMGGAKAHLANPDAPAWQNMAGTAEGRRKGEGWAKQAIWGNVPDGMKANYPGGVDSLTSRQFVDLWKSKVERTPLNIGTAAAMPQSAPLGAPRAPLNLDNAVASLSPASAPSVPGLSQGLPAYGFTPNNAPAGISGLPSSPQMAQAPPEMAPLPQMAVPLGAPRHPPDLTQLRALLARGPQSRAFSFSRTA
jgi:hypothetical protein